MFNHRYQSRQRIDFDGVDESIYTTTPPSVCLSQTVGSMSFWFRLDTLGGIMLGTGDTSVQAFPASMRVTQRINATLPDPSAYYLELLHIKWGVVINPQAGVTTKLLTGVDYFAVITSSGTTTKMYINNVAQTMQAFNGAANLGEWWGDVGFIGATKYFCMGQVFANNSFLGVSADGKIDEFALWDKELSASEVAELYNSGVPSNLLSSSVASNLTNWWKMGEGGENGSIATVYDRAGSTNLIQRNMENGDIQNVSY